MRSRSGGSWSARKRLLSLSGRPEVIRKFIRLTRAHVHGALKVPAVAKRLGMNVRFLTRLSVKELGYPPGVVIDLARIVRVAKEIATTQRGFTAIARRYGFPDQAGMNRQFKRIVGVPPGVYRTQATREGHRGRRGTS
jgi:transcriptional regulator GlxA family with amidase domain